MEGSNISRRDFLRSAKKAGKALVTTTAAFKIAESLTGCEKTEEKNLSENYDNETKEILETCFQEYIQMYENYFKNMHLKNPATREELYIRFYSFYQKYAKNVVIKDAQLGYGYEGAGATIRNDTIFYPVQKDEENGFKIMVGDTNENNLFITDNPKYNFGLVIAELAHVVKGYKSQRDTLRNIRDYKEARDSLATLTHPLNDRADTAGFLTSITHQLPNHLEYDTHKITEKIIMMYLFEPSGSKEELGNLLQNGNLICSILYSPEYSEFLTNERLKDIHRILFTPSNTIFLREDNSELLQGQLLKLKEMRKTNNLSKEGKLWMDKEIRFTIIDLIKFPSSSYTMLDTEYKTAKIVDDFIKNKDVETFEKETVSLSELFNKKLYLQEAIIRQLKRLENERMGSKLLLEETIKRLSHR